MRSVVLLVSAWAWSCDDENATTLMTKVVLEEVCNDGTPAAYYYAPGDDTVLIYLAGGGQCWDATSCMQRYNGTAYPYHDCRNASQQCYMSSKDYPDTCNKTGIFSENPLNPLATATKVYLPYCSSDAHVGDAEYAGWQFRGKRIVAAVLAQFEGRPLVFGGGSAGARGAMLALDKGLGFLDSPYYLDLAPYNESFVGFPELSKAAYTNFNVTVHEQCKQAYFQEPWKCTMGQYALPFVTTPRLVVAAQFDAWQLSNAVLGYNGIADDPQFDDDQLAYVASFGNATRALLSTTSTVFSPACYSHHTSEKEDFWTATTLDGATQASALAALINGASLADHIDVCASYNCGACL